jgi:hypothetical protein
MVKRSQKGKQKREWTPWDEDHRDWLERGLKLQGKTKKGAAGAIEREQSAISQMLVRKRRFQSGEVEKIAGYFGPGCPPPNGRAPDVGAGTVSGETAVPPNTGLRIEAIIAHGYWGKDGAVSIAPQVSISGRPDAKFAGLQQYLCALRADPNVYFICAPFTALRVTPLDSEKVHVRRTRENGEHEDTIRMISVGPGGAVNLVLLEVQEGDDVDRNLAYPSQIAGESIEIRGLVLVRAVTENV